jgi:hypothetical protein
MPSIRIVVKPLYIENLPIAPGRDVEFVGSEYITASIGQWIKQVIEVIADSWEFSSPIVTGLRKIEMDSSENTSNLHMLFFSVIFGNREEVMCGGCTNFSGEGGRGGENALNFLRVLATLFNLNIEVKHYNYPIYEEVLKILIDAENTEI